MSYLAKLRSQKNSTFSISVKANNRKEARSLITNMYPNMDIVSLEPGRCHERLNFVR